MFTGQVNWTGPSGFAGARVVRDNFANGDDAKAAFALVYETILGLSEEQCSETGTSDNWLDADASGGLPTTYDSSQLWPETNIGSGGGQFHSAGKGLAAQRDVAGVRNPGSSMGGVMSEGTEVQVVPDGNIAPPSSSAGVLNKSQLSDWMDAHALTRSSHHCAMYVRQGMEASGINTGDRPRSGDAGDYGSFLLRHGAQTVPLDSYAPQVGDVVVFDKTSQHPYGHIEMYDGHKWVSDFVQNSFSPYRDAASTPPFTIYRLG
jgi:hypothetical protein